MVSKKNVPAFGVTALSLLVIATLLYACISLLCLDGALADTLESILFHWRTRDFFPPLVMAVIAALVQWFLRRSKFRWLPPAIGLAGLLLADLLWLCSTDYGGNILAALLVRAAGPICVGSVAVIILSRLHNRSKSAKCVAAGILLVVLAGCIWAWPRPLTARIDIRFDGKAAFYNETAMAAEVQLSHEDLESLLHRAEIYPCLTEQPWKGEWAMAVRLNEQYILMAPRDGTPCIYAYAGDMATFDLTRPKWTVYSNKLHYDGLMLYSTGWADDTEQETASAPSPMLQEASAPEQIDGQKVVTLAGSSDFAYPMTLESIVPRADTIVEAAASAISYEAHEGNPWTKVSVQVEHTLYGSAPEGGTMDVYIYGGYMPLKDYVSHHGLGHHFADLTAEELETSILYAPKENEELPMVGSRYLFCLQESASGLPEGSYQRIGQKFCMFHIEADNETYTHATLIPGELAEQVEDALMIDATASVAKAALYAQIQQFRNS